jgi:O-succinylbenzoic acid--CoA ligase
MRPWLAARAARHPGHLALIAAGRRLSFGDLSTRVDLLARRLAAAGAGPGLRVAMIAGSSLRAVEMVHAVQRLGAVLVPLNPRLAPNEIARLVGFVRPAVTVADQASGAHDVVSAVDLQGLDRVRPASPSVLRDVIPPGDIHTIVFTSGTSGAPKGVMLTHANHAASAAAAATRLGSTGGDRWLLCLPICHVGGLAIVLRSVLDGFPVVVRDGFDPEVVNRTIDEESVTIASVVPTMLSHMLEAAGGRPYPAWLRCVLTGGGPLPPTLAERARTRKVPVTQTYGLTEAASQVATAVPGHPAEPGIVGAPLPGVTVRIDAPDADGVGEIVVAGPVVMHGYFDNDEATAAMLHAGWLRTGDLGLLDQAGRLSIAGRRNDLVVTGGENVHPTEVEAVLLAHSSVAEAAVYGVEDDVWGERVEARVVPVGDDVDVVALRRWCAARLAGFKVPKAFHVVSTLPRTPSGKLRRDALRAGRPSGTAG